MDCLPDQRFHLRERGRSILRTASQITTVTKCVDNLVHNAIEANATSVAIRLNFTQFKIQVVDNGLGMSESQLNQLQMSGQFDAFDKKACDSNCTKAESLACIKAACRSLFIISRAENSDKTYFRLWKSGKPDEQSEEASENRAARGTTIIVENLFFNQPIRQKLIRPPIELNHIKRRLSSISLVHPHVSFSLRDDTSNTIILQIKKREDLLERFCNAYPEVSRSSLVEVEVTVEKFQICGIISRNTHHENNLQIVCVNKHLLLNSSVHDLLNYLLSKSFYLKGINFKRGGKCLDQPFNTEILKDLEKLEHNRSKFDLSPCSPLSQKVKHAIFFIAISCPQSEYNIVFTPKSTQVSFLNGKAFDNCLQSAVQQFLSFEDYFKNVNCNKENIIAPKEINPIMNKKSCASLISRRIELALKTSEELSKKKENVPSMTSESNDKNFNLSRCFGTFPSDFETHRVLKSPCFEHKTSIFKPHYKPQQEPETVQKKKRSRYLVTRDTRAPVAQVFGLKKKKINAEEVPINKIMFPSTPTNPAGIANVNLATDLETLKINFKASSKMHLRRFQSKTSIGKPHIPHKVSETAEKNKICKKFVGKIHHVFDFQTKAESVLTDLTKNSIQDFRKQKKPMCGESILTNLYADAVMDCTQLVEDLRKNMLSHTRENLDERQNPLWIKSHTTKNPETVVKCEKYTNELDRNLSMQAGCASNKYSTTSTSRFEKWKTTENVLTDFESISSKNLGTPKKICSSFLAAESHLFNQKTNVNDLLTDLSSVVSLKPAGIDKKYRNSLDSMNFKFRKASKKSKEKKTPVKSKRPIQMKAERKRKLVARKVSSSPKTIAKNLVTENKSSATKNQKSRNKQPKSKIFFRKIKSNLPMKSSFSEANKNNKMAKLKKQKLYNEHKLNKSFGKLCPNDHKSCMLISRKMSSHSCPAQNLTQDKPVAVPLKKNRSINCKRKLNKSFDNVRLDSHEKKLLSSQNGSCVPARSLNLNEPGTKSLKEKSPKNSKPNLCRSFVKKCKLNQNNQEKLSSKNGSCIFPTENLNQDDTAKISCKDKIFNRKLNKSFANIFLKNFKNSRVIQDKSDSRTIFPTREMHIDEQVVVLQHRMCSLKNNFKNLCLDSQKNCKTVSRNIGSHGFLETASKKIESAVAPFLQKSLPKHFQHQNMYSKQVNNESLKNNGTTAFFNQSIHNCCFEYADKSEIDKLVSVPIRSSKPVISEVSYCFPKLYKENNEYVIAAKSNSLRLHRKIPKKLLFSLEKELPKFGENEFKFLLTDTKKFDTTDKFLEVSTSMNSEIYHRHNSASRSVFSLVFKNRDSHESNLYLLAQPSKVVKPEFSLFSPCYRGLQEQNFESGLHLESLNSKVLPHFKPSKFHDPNSQYDYETLMWEHHNSINTQTKQNSVIRFSEERDCIQSAITDKEPNTTSSEFDLKILKHDPDGIQKCKDVSICPNIVKIPELVNCKLYKSESKDVDINSYNVYPNILNRQYISVSLSNAQYQSEILQPELTSSFKATQCLEEDPISKKYFIDIANTCSPEDKRFEISFENATDNINFPKKGNHLYSSETSNFIGGGHTLSSNSIIDSVGQPRLEVLLGQGNYNECIPNDINKYLLPLEKQKMVEIEEDNSCSSDTSSLSDPNSLTLTEDFVSNTSSVEFREESQISAEPSVSVDKQDMDFVLQGLDKLAINANCLESGPIVLPENRTNHLNETENSIISDYFISSTLNSDELNIHTHAAPIESMTASRPEVKENASKNVCKEYEFSPNHLKTNTSISVNPILVNSVSGMSFILPSIQNTCQLPTFDVKDKHHLFSTDITPTKENFKIPKNRGEDSLQEPDHETLWGMLSRFDSFAAKFSTLKSKGFESVEKIFAENVSSDFSLSPHFRTMLEKTPIKSVSASRGLFVFEKKLFHKLEIIGQLDSKFILTVVELYDSRLIVVFDQHAVDERIRVEKLMIDYCEDVKSKVWKSVNVNPSITANLSKEHAALCTHFRRKFEKVGLYFLVNEISLNVTKVPLCLLNSAQKNNDILRDLIVELLNEIITSLINLNGVCPSVPRCLLNAVNDEACKRAVKFGDKLSNDQCKSLLEGLKTCQFPFQCAHGRPLLVPLIDMNKFSL